MPTYDYECLSCGYTFELFQQMTAPLLTNCPKCGNKVKRLIGSGTGVIFKGSGFYATDYRKKEPKEKQTCPQQAVCNTKNCPAKE